MCRVADRAGAPMQRAARISATGVGLSSCGADEPRGQAVRGRRKSTTLAGRLPEIVFAPMAFYEAKKLQVEQDAVS
jgi:hypothetical protein